LFEFYRVNGANAFYVVQTYTAVRLVTSIQYLIEEEFKVSNDNFHNAALYVVLSSLNFSILTGFNAPNPRVAWNAAVLNIRALNLCRLKLIDFVKYIIICRSSSEDIEANVNGGVLGMDVELGEVVSNNPLFELSDRSQ
jgi:hypothetical protein